jgi:hypothetical protein
MAEVIRLIPEHIEIAYFQSDAQGYDLRVDLRHCVIMTVFVTNTNSLSAILSVILTKSCCLKLQVVKSAKNLIQRVGRIMLEVDVLPGKNGYYVENSNKQVFRMIVALTPHF